MAKRYKNPDVDKILKLSDETPDRVEWVNSRGISIVLKAIPPYLVQMAMEAIDKPDPPTYTVSLAGGGEETHVHDETSILQSSEVEKIKWAEYLITLNEIQEMSTEILLDIILIEGVEVSPQVEEEQVKKMRFLKIKIPEDPQERSLAVRKAFIIGGKEDAETITSMVMVLTGVSADDLKLTKKSFQNKVESGPQRGNGNPLGESEDS